MKQHLLVARDYLHEMYGDFLTPEKTCIVLSGPRSGSNLLLRHLEAIGYGKPVEAFHGNNERIKREHGWDINFDDPFEFISHAIEYQTVKGICGVKLGWYQFQHYLKLARELFKDYSAPLTDWDLVEVFFTNPSYIHLVRKNKVKQAISFSKGQQTGVWYIPADDDGEYKNYVLPPVYDREHIERCFGLVLSVDAQWMTLLASDQISHKVVWYEEYVADYETQLREIDSYMGGVGEITVPELPLLKLADKTTLNWVERFESETPWLKEPLVKKAMEKPDLLLLMALLSNNFFTKAEDQYFLQMPSTRTKPIRKFYYSVRRKLKKFTQI